MRLRPLALEGSYPHVSNGLPGFTIVGLPDAAVREARDRVRAAILSSGLPWPLRRVTVNLAPAAVEIGNHAATRANGVMELAPNRCGVLEQVAQVCGSGLGDTFDGSQRRANAVLRRVAAQADLLRRIVTEHLLEES